jgi:hypothetical protein
MMKNLINVNLPKSDETIHALAGAEKNTKSAAGLEKENEIHKIYLWMRK